MGIGILGGTMFFQVGLCTLLRTMVEETHFCFAFSLNETVLKLYLKLIAAMQHVSFPFIFNFPCLKLDFHMRFYVWYFITNNSIKRRKDLQNGLCFNFELNDYIKSSDHFGKGIFRQKNN